MTSIWLPSDTPARANHCWDPEGLSLSNRYHDSARTGTQLRTDFPGEVTTAVRFTRTAADANRLIAIPVSPSLSPSTEVTIKFSLQASDATYGYFALRPDAQTSTGQVNLGNHSVGAGVTEWEFTLTTSATTPTSRHSIVFVANAGAIGEWVDATATLVEEGASAGDLFSGDTPDDPHTGPGYAYAWAGTPDASASYQYALEELVLEAVDIEDVLPAPTIDPRTTHREEEYRVEILDRDGGVLGELDGVGDGSIDQNVHARISGGGFIDVDGAQAGIDWLNYRIRPWCSVAGYGEWPLGVFSLSAPRVHYGAEDTDRRVNLYDGLLVLDEDKVDYVFTVDEGVVATTAIRDLLAPVVGEANLAITVSDETLSAAMFWEAGTPKLTIVNDLLDAINYFSLRCDGYGRYVAEPYARPQDRPSVWTFEDDDRAIHGPDIYREEDLASIPNKYILISAATLETEALISTATAPASSRFSYESRGRWIVETEELVDVTSQSVLDAMAQRRLDAAMSASANLELSYDPIELALNDSIGLSSIDLPLRYATVQKTRQRIYPGASATLVAREVI